MVQAREHTPTGETLVQIKVPGKRRSNASFLFVKGGGEMATQKKNLKRASSDVRGIEKIPILNPNDVQKKPAAVKKPAAKRKK